MAVCTEDKNNSNNNIDLASYIHLHKLLNSCIP